MSFFISSAFAEAVPPVMEGPNPLFQVLLLVGFLIIFYTLVMRPQRKRDKAKRDLIVSLQKGDEVVTSGGIAGRITKVTEGFVVVEVSDKMELKFQRASIIASLPKGTIKAI
ncbi:MAG: preprotein translocase subunit YajC [Pseudomonadales bacterium]|nr:preprotein translocase subunit YajC [Pseudomonadales bacterium]